MKLWILRVWTMFTRRSRDRIIAMCFGVTRRVAPRYIRAAMRHDGIFGVEYSYDQITWYGFRSDQGDLLIQCLENPSVTAEGFDLRMRTRLLPLTRVGRYR